MFMEETAIVTTPKYKYHQNHWIKFKPQKGGVNFA